MIKFENLIITEIEKTAKIAVNVLNKYQRQRGKGLNISAQMREELNAERNRALWEYYYTRDKQRAQIADLSRWTGYDVYYLYDNADADITNGNAYRTRYNAISRRYYNYDNNRHLKTTTKIVEIKDKITGEILDSYEIEKDEKDSGKTAKKGKKFAYYPQVAWLHAGNAWINGKTDDESAAGFDRACRDVYNTAFLLHSAFTKYATARGWNPQKIEDCNDILTGIENGKKPAEIIPLLDRPLSIRTIYHYVVDIRNLLIDNGYCDAHGNILDTIPPANRTARNIKHK